MIICHLLSVIYNGLVPTPFTHLVIARDIVDDPRLPPDLRQALMAEWPAFLFGNIAPDAQTVSGQPREATHFFPVPLGSAPPAPQRLFARHPELARPERLPGAQAAFLAGYLAHLALDQLWVREIFETAFGLRARWGTFDERLYLHNALRAYWDADDLRQLSSGTTPSLRAAQPMRWLPFLADDALQRWRDLVAEQLASGEARTVEVFAQRMRADPRALAALVASPEAMQTRVFAHVSLDRLARYRADALARCVQWMQNYWENAPLT
jgi:hypothetical protein